ncbi:MAG: dihydrofolate reductase [Candidatus Yonathbacteria bacterium]|nr:dihydrofolate reductase [Candidatus Yonathbacteria bacterium]
MGPIIIAAVAHENVIGCRGILPWGHLHADLKRFKAITLGHTVVMGYETFTSLGRPLHGRNNLILTRHPQKLVRFGSLVGHVDSVESVIEIAEKKEVFIIGGGNVYQQFIKRPEVRIMYITRISSRFHGDVFFPNFSTDDWKMTRRDEHDAVGNENTFPLSFETWIRKK